MNLRTKLSLTLNALLLGFVVWLTCAEPRSELRADLSRSLTKRGLRVKPQSTPPSFTSEPLPEVVVVSEAFDWAQLESADYHDYVANLRAIGCPEPTVRDIIIADVNDLFTPPTGGRSGSALVTFCPKKNARDSWPPRRNSNAPGWTSRKRRA